MEGTNSNMVRLAAWRANTQAGIAAMRADPDRHAAWRANQQAGIQAGLAAMHADPGRRKA